MVNKEREIEREQESRKRGKENSVIKLTSQLIGYRNHSLDVIGYFAALIVVDTRGSGR